MKKLLYISFFTFLFSLFTFDVISQPSITWQKTYSGPSPVNNSRGNCISTQNSHFILGSSGGGYLIRIDNFGDTIWTRFFPGGGTTRIASSGDGGCVFPAGTFDSAGTRKVDSMGNTVWQKNYNFQGGEYRCINKSIDGGYIICGDVFPSGTQIFKVNSSGDLQWRKYFSIIGTTLTLYSVIDAYNEGFIAIGTRGSQFDSTKVVLLRLNPNGDLIWNKYYYIFNKEASGKEINKYYGNYLICGQTTDTNGNQFCVARIYLSKLDTSGNVLTSNIVFNNKNEFVQDMQIINPNRFVYTATSLGGANCNDTVIGTIFLTDSVGNRTASKSFVYPLGDVDINRLTVLNNGDIIFTGYLDSMNWNQPLIFAIRTDSMLNVKPIGIVKNNSDIPDVFALKQNYPNPFNPQTTIEYDIPKDNFVMIKIYDVLGREVFNVNEFKKVGSYKVKFDGSDLASGIYFYSIESGNFKDTKKMVLIK